MAGLIVAVAAFISGLLATVSAELDTPALPSATSGQTPSIREEVENLRVAARELVEARLQQSEALSIAAGAAEPPPAGDAPPEPGGAAKVDDPAVAVPGTHSEDAPEPADSADCRTQEASGEGWVSMLVSCVSQQVRDGASSVSISSSSSVNVQVTSTSDAP